MLGVRKTTFIDTKLNMSQQETEYQQDQVDRFLLKQYKMMTVEKNDFSLVGSQTNLKLDSDEQILRNPVYQKMQFYPFRNQLIWQEKEEQLKQKNMDDHYEAIKDGYMKQLAEVYTRMKKEGPETPQSKAIK